MAKSSEIFRKKALDHISSPEQLTDYLKVTNPGIWLVLTAVIVLLAGIFAWAAIGTLETTAEAKVIVKDRAAQVVTVGNESIESGMTIRIASNEYVVAAADTDDYGRTVGLAEIPLPDGTYDATLVVELIRPIEFLFSST